MRRPAPLLLAIAGAVASAVPFAAAAGDALPSHEEVLVDQLLNARADKVRKAACERLLDRRAPVVESFGKAFLADPSKAVRHCASVALDKVGSPAEVAPIALKGLASSQPRDVRLDSARLLRQRSGPEVIPGLAAAAATETDRDVLFDVVDALAESTRRSPERRRLHALLEGASIDLDKAVSRAMHRHPDPTDTPALIRLLRSQSAEVVKDSAEALYDLGDPAAIPALRQAARDVVDDGLAGDLNAIADKLEARSVRR